MELTTTHREAHRAGEESTMDEHDYSDDACREAAISYDEACDHAEMNWRNTNGIVGGGTYYVRFENGDVQEIDLRIRNGLARLVL